MENNALGRIVNFEQLHPYQANSSVSNFNGDFTAEIVPGTKKITFSGITITNAMVILGRFFYYNGEYVRSIDFSSFKISGNTLELSNMNGFFESGSEVYCILNLGRLRGFDSDLDIYKYLNQNPDKRDVCSVMALYKDTDKAIGTYFTEFESNYYDIEAHVAITDATGATVKVYYSLDEDDTVPDTDGTAGGNWKEVTTSLFGGAVSGTDINEIGLIEKRRGRFLVEIDIANATNVVKFLIKKI